MKPLALILCLLVVGCAAFTSYKAHYDIGLTQVERPSDAKERYGEVEIAPGDSTGQYTFSDGMVDILWICTANGIVFTLENKTGHSIKIIWDETVFVDADGNSQRVMHEGVKYIDRNSPMPPSVVAKKGKITDLIFPAENVYYVSGKYGGWQEAPILPYKNMDELVLQKEAGEYVGKEFQILLALEIEDVVNEYTFSFKIKGVETRK